MELLSVSFGVASLVALVYAILPNITHQKIKYRKTAWITLIIFILLTIGIYLFKNSGDSCHLKKT